MRPDGRARTRRPPSLRCAAWGRKVSGPSVHFQFGLTPQALYRTLLARCRSIRGDGGDAFLVDVEGEERQRRVAGIAPLVHEAGRLIDEASRSSRLRLALDRVGAGPGQDIIEGRTGAVVWRIRRHMCRERHSRQVEIVRSRLQVGNRSSCTIQLPGARRCRRRRRCTSAAGASMK